MFPAHSCLRHAEEPPGRGGFATRQDVGRDRSARAAAPPRAPCPQILTQHPHHAPERRSLWPPGSDAMVREQRRRLRVRVAGIAAALARRRREVRRNPSRTRADTGRLRARLHASPAQGEILGQGASRRRPHRGRAARPRRAFRRHRHRRRLTGMDVRDALLRARPDGWFNRLTTSSSCTRRNWRPTAPRAVRLSPIKFGSGCTPAPMG